MSRTRVIRYTTKAEAAEENQRLIEAVFAELTAVDPGGVRYASFRLEDGVSFVHVVTYTGADDPLTGLPAFAAFQAGIAERCVAGPTPAGATIVGSYG